MPRQSSLLGLFLLLFATIPATGAVFVVPADSELIDHADAIVIGTVSEIHSEFTVEGPIVTNIDIEVEEVLKGAFDGSEPVRLREDGGVIGDFFTAVSGSAHYWTGNRALIFLQRTEEGWRTWGMSLGKFDFVEDREGRALAVRWATNQSDVLAWTPAGHPHEEKLRSAAPFLAFIRNHVEGTRPPLPPKDPRTLEATAGAADYFVGDLTIDEVSFLPPVTDAHFPPSAYTYGNFRWKTFDEGGSAVYRSNGTQAGYDAVGAAQRALAAWTNDPGSNVNLQYGGTTSAGFTQDSLSTIVFSSASDVPEGSVGYAQWFGYKEVCPPEGCTHVYKGETFNTIVEGDVAVKAGISVSQKVFDEIVTHEVGHTIGFRHSDQGTPSSTQAVMKAILSGAYGATLGPWDVDAVRHVYTSATTTPTPPAVTFTDDPLVPRVTIIKALHLVELRNAVNAWRSAAGLAPFTAWTDPVPAGATIKAVHILELRNALDPALRAFGRTPAFSSGVAVGQPVMAVHFQELRNVMK